MIPYFKINKGFRYLITVIDIILKYAWAVPVRSKNGKDITTAMKSLLTLGRIPKNLNTDKGKEFYNLQFRSLMQQFNIKLYSTYSNLKASIIERFNRTLKNKMWIQFSLQGNYQWVDILSTLVSEYNDSKHRTIGMKPKDVTATDEEVLLQRFHKQKKMIPKRPKFKIGDKVRVSKFKNVFEKGYTPNWTTEIFTVDRVISTNPIAG